MIISTCGFGHVLSWDFGTAPPGQMTFGDALTIVSGSYLAVLILPSWVFRLPIKKYGVRLSFRREADL